MPFCIVCDSHFYPATWADPGESCGCNACYSSDYIETEDDVREVAELSRQWRAQLDATERESE